MLILPPGHGQAAVGRRTFTKRERWIVGSVVAVSVALVVVVIIAVAIPGGRTARGCLNVEVPGPIGAQEFRQCGAAARAFCSSIASAADLSRVARQDVAAACRRQGLPTG
jgi:hypothetical protein